MKFKKVALVCSVVSLAIILTSASVYAAPPPGKGKPDGNGGDKNKVVETPSSTHPTDFSIAIEDHAFTPSGPTVSDTSGDGLVTVEWTNYDKAPHSVMFMLSDDTVVYSGKLKYLQSWKYTFPASGVYSYHCHQHEKMVATVTVTEL